MSDRDWWVVWGWQVMLFGLLQQMIGAYRERTREWKDRK